jgi:signal transduction histidine kinase
MIQNIIDKVGLELVVVLSALTLLSVQVVSMVALARLRRVAKSLEEMKKQFSDIRVSKPSRRSGTAKPTKL